MRFTDKQLVALKPRRSRYELVEAGGLAVRVAPAGAKTFALLLRVNGKAKRVTLGRYVVPGYEGGSAHGAHGLERLSLADARLRAAEARKLAAAGKDPAARAVDQHKAALDAITVRGLFDQYLEHHAKRNKRASSKAEDERQAKKDILPAWGDKKARDITRREAIALLDGIVARGSPVAANRLQALLSKLFKFALERDLIPGSPMANVRKPGGKETGRKRVLSDAELVEVWQAAGTLGKPDEQLLKLLLLTGQRRGEVAGLRWDEIDDAERLWLLPAARAKANIDHEVPLADTVGALLSQVPRKRKGSARSAKPRRPRNTEVPAPIGEKPLSCLFPQRSNDLPMREFKGIKRALDAHLAKERRDAGSDPMPAWVLHDLRRKFRTGLSRLRVESEIAERVLGHVPAGVRGVYDRHDYRAEKRIALEAWALHVAKLLNPPAKNVVTLHETAA